MGVDVSGGGGWNGQGWGLAGIRIGWVEGLAMSLMRLIFSTFIMKVIFLIFKKLTLLEKISSKHLDEPNIKKLKNILLRNKHTC